ncbi:MAG: HAD family hydrolase [bacterium]|nr:HAD family hydrolase [bacterium]
MWVRLPPAAHPQEPGETAWFFVAIFAHIRHTVVCIAPVPPTSGNMTPIPEPQPTPRYIAMWSGPRNISTALMRAWGSRADTHVIDEPFYAHYLLHTPYRADHPGAEEVIAAHETDPQRVIAHLTGPIPNGKTIFYQKHMTHHMIEGIPLDWLAQVTHCFLIRDPREVIASFIKVIPDVKLDQTGLPGQAALFDQVWALTGEPPPVIDSNDVLRDPHRVLSRLCARIGVPFDAAMLAWEPGRRATDGVWAKYWYAAVEASSGFQPQRQHDDPLPLHLEALAAECAVLYQRMAAHRIV